jgi:ribose transport system permease protein
VTSDRPGWFAKGRYLTLPAAALVVAVIAFALLPLYAGHSLASYDIFNLLEQFAQLALVTLGFGLVVMAGEFDLSIVGIFALSGVIAVELGDDHPIVGVLAALAICTAFGAAQGYLIAKFRIPSMPVTLATYIGLLGLTRVIGHDKASVSFSNIDATLWIQKPIFQIFSPRSLIMLGVFALAAATLYATRWGRELRALGGDRKASRTAGIPVDRRLVGLFAASSALGVIGGSLSAFNTGAAITDPGTSLLTLGAAGALIGGVALTGGTGSVPGLFAGTMSIALLEQIFVIANYPEYINNLCFGLVLFVFVVVNAPDGRDGIARFRAARRTSKTDPAESTNAPART